MPDTVKIPEEKLLLCGGYILMTKIRQSAKEKTYEQNNFISFML